MQSRAFMKAFLFLVCSIDGLYQSIIRILKAQNFYLRNSVLFRFFDFHKNTILQYLEARKNIMFLYINKLFSDRNKVFFLENINKKIVHKKIELYFIETMRFFVGHGKKGWAKLTIFWKVG